MKVDCHFHIGLHNFDTPGSIIGYLDRSRIDKVWLLSWEERQPVIDEAYTHVSIERIWEAHLQYPDRIVPFYAPDPTADGSLRAFEEWHARGVAGFAELKSTIRWTDPRLAPILEYLNGTGLPVIFHMEESGVKRMPRSGSTGDVLLAEYSSRTKWKGWSSRLLGVASLLSPKAKAAIEGSAMERFHPGYMLDFDSLEKVLRKYPRVGFVGHGPLFWKGIAADAPASAEAYPGTRVASEGTTCRLLEEHDNLHADLSGPSGFNALNRDRRFARHFLDKFRKKVLFGTDNFQLGLEALLLSSGLTSEAKERIFGLNAHELIKKDRRE